jgi:hypothetical protein
LQAAATAAGANLSSVLVWVGPLETKTTTQLSYNTLCKFLPGPLAAGATTATCDFPGFGQYITVHVNSTISAVLSLCEIEPVYANSGELKLHVLQKASAF